MFKKGKLKRGKFCHNIFKKNFLQKTDTTNVKNFADFLWLPLRISKPTFMLWIEACVRYEILMKSVIDGGRVIYDSSDHDIWVKKNIVK